MSDGPDFTQLEPEGLPAITGMSVGGMNVVDEDGAALPVIVMQFDTGQSLTLHLPQAIDAGVQMIRAATQMNTQFATAQALIASGRFTTDQVNVLMQEISAIAAGTKPVPQDAPVEADVERPGLVVARGNVPRTDDL